MHARLDEAEFRDLLEMAKKASFSGKQNKQGPQIQNMNHSKPARTMTHFPFLFGVDGKKTLSVGEFVSMVNQLKRSLLELEFDCQNPITDGTITAQAFAGLLISYAPRRIANKHSERDYSDLQAHPFEDLLGFQRVIDSIEEIETVLRIFVNSNATEQVHFSEFKRATKAVTNFEFNERQEALLCKVFGGGDYGHVNYGDIVTSLKARAHRGHGAPRGETGITRVVGCISNCVMNGMGASSATE